MALLEVDNLQTHFFTREGVVRAVDGVSFTVEPGKTLGIVGESGCGKSVTALSIMGLLPQPPAKIVGGSVRFEGFDLAKLSDRNLEDVRGNEIAMIFQDPMTSLNPTLKIGTQIMETMRAPPRARSEAGAASVRSSCSKRCTSRTRPSGWTTTRTGSRAACASA